MKVPGVDALRDALAALSLDTRGHKDVLKKRLRTASKRKEQAQPGVCKIPKQTRPESQDFDSYLVLDFEATCQRNEPAHGSFFGFPNEIIEFPVVLLQWRQKPNKRVRTTSDSSDDTASLSSSSSTSSSSSSLPSSPEPASEPIEKIPDSEWQLEIIDEFRKFVRPTWRPKLSKFCTELTGITQQDVDPAETFAETLETFCFEFMQKHNLFTRINKTVWVTDGPWDLRDFISKQCHISGIERPPYLSGPYIDLRSSSTAYFSSTPLPQAAAGAEGSVISPPTTRAMGSANIPAVLEKLGLGGFQGREHSGIDDVRNIARILQELARYERGWRVTANARIKGKERSWDWMKKKGEVDWPHPPGE